MSVSSLRLILYSDIPTSATTSSIETILVTILTRPCAHSWSWLVVISAPPRLSSPCTLRLGWTTASAQNPASKWISHGVTTLGAEYLLSMFLMRACPGSGVCVISWWLRRRGSECGRVYSSVGTSSPTEYSAPLHRGCRSRGQWPGRDAATRAGAGPWLAMVEWWRW